MSGVLSTAHQLSVCSVYDVGLRLYDMMSFEEHVISDLIDVILTSLKPILETSFVHNKNV